MRRLMIVLAALLLLGGTAKVYADTRTIFSEEKSYLPSDDFKKYIRVKNNSDDNAALSNGQAVLWDIRNSTSTAAQPSDRFSVTTGTVAGSPLAAGIVTETIAQGAYGWVQVWGIHNTANLVAASGRGNALELSSTRGRLKPVDNTSTPANGGYPIGVNLSDAGSSGNQTSVIFVQTQK